MCHQKTGLSLQSHFRVLLLYFLLHHFCTGQSQLIGSSQPITAVAGGDVILPCHLEPAQDITTSTVEWTRSDLKPRFIHVLRAGQELMNMKNPSYNGRTLVFVEELKHGNISLKLSRVKPGDEGTYRCFIPEITEEAFVELVVASALVCSPVISLSGMDRDRGGVVLQCESRGWYPEPEVLWLDAEGNLLSAGPPETVRGPDDLYTVSSRVTVDKRHNNSFTCRVQQKDTHQTREAHIHVPDDFFLSSSSSAVPIITGLAVSLAVSIMVILACVFFVWRQNRSKTKKRSRDEAEKEKLLEETKDLTEKYEKIEEELKNKIEQVNELKEEKKKLEEELETRNKEMEEIKDELEKIKAAASWSIWFPLVNEQKEEKKKLEEELETRNKEMETRNKETEEIKDEEEKKKLKEKLETRNKELEEIKKKLKDIEREIKCEMKTSGGFTVEVNNDYRFICLRNESDQDKPLGGRQLKVQINNSEPITYTFDPSMELKTGEFVTLCHPHYHEIFPESRPGDLVWSDLKSWWPGDRFQVSLQ